MKVAATTLASPVGRLVVAATERGVVRIAFDDEPADAVLEDLADELGARVTRDTSLTAAARAELAAYFARRLRSFSVPVDRTLIPTGFTRKVLAATARIPYGAVATYGEIAGRAGAPRGARAAGNALNANPIPIVIPCHRVVPASGGAGGYGGSEWRKVALLAIEGVEP